MKDYKKAAREIRKKVLKLIHAGQTSHIGSNYSCIDILTVLYAKVDLDRHLKEDRDKVVYSKGWAAASAYVFLAEKGIIPEEDLRTFGKPGTKYIGLVEPTVRGIETAGGSMGYGLPFGVGFALAKKLKNEKGMVYVLMSDGEQPIGTTWESAMIGSHHKLDNLCVIVDCNGFQAMGRVEEVLSIEPIVDKWKAFGWDAIEIDGHNYTQIEAALDKKSNGKPRAIIARTTKGKGVSFMENKLEWHYKTVSDEDYRKALHELDNTI